MRLCFFTPPAKDSHLKITTHVGFMSTTASVVQPSQVLQGYNQSLFDGLTVINAEQWAGQKKATVAAADREVNTDFSALRMFTEDKQGSYLFHGFLFDVVEGRCRQSNSGLGTKCGFIGKRSRQGVVVVIGQAGALAASLGLLLMPRGRGLQLPSPFLAQRLSGSVDCVHPIVVGVERFRLVTFGVTDVGFIASNRGPTNHVGNLKKS